jgi:hypothetical protein
MTISQFVSKVKRRLWSYLVRYSRNRKFYPRLYRSYWHYKLSSNKNSVNTDCYYTARPNPGAGIGHQLANWTAGYWFAKQFGLRFAHLPFSNQQWEDFLGFGEGEKTVKELKKEGYKIRKLPLFGENDSQEISLIESIIRSYAEKKVVFLAEQDQFYHDQFGVGVMDSLKDKFHNAPFRQNDKIRYNKEKFNIAVHVRRTVVIGDKVIEETDGVKAKRWLSNDYYEKVLQQVLENIKVNKPLVVWLFSTGKPEEFAEFEKYGEVHFCSDINEYQSFAHLVFADLLITSKSSFSHESALLNNGIKVCPRNFWHGYPCDKKWILVEDNGTFDIDKLNQVLK